MTVNVDVRKGSDGSTIISSGAATNIGGGYYKYQLGSSATTAADDYLAVARTTDTSVDWQHIPAMYTLGRAGVDNLNVLVSTRSASGAIVTRI